MNSEIILWEAKLSLWIDLFKGLMALYEKQKLELEQYKNYNITCHTLVPISEKNY